MTLGTAAKKRHPKVPRRHGEGGKSHLTVIQGLAALSLDALSSVAYGPEAIVLVLVAAGPGGLDALLPITFVIAALLAVLVVSYRQVIAVHPDGGGAYAVAKKDLGRPVSLLAAASLIVDYVLTVAVSLAAGAASVASAFPALAGHELAVSLIGLVVITAVNLRGIADSAKVLMLPMVLFVISVLAIIVVGLFRSEPVATVGEHESFPAVEALGLLLVLKAFSAGCSALTGVEAIANAVPMFRKPRVKRAQHTELLLGLLLGVLLIGLASLIHRHDVVPREDATLLAQLTAAAFGTGAVYYAISLLVTLVLGIAANTSFGGLPVLMSLLAKDDRLPHVFALRSERPVHRWGVAVLAVLAGVLLLIVNAETDRLIPLYAIGVFVGFTISQIGLVRHWRTQRPDRWWTRALINCFGAVLTAVAGAVLLATKFTEGAWIVVLLVPLLMLLFSRIERYYTLLKDKLSLDTTPRRPPRKRGLVIVPLGGVDAVAVSSLDAAFALGDEVVVVAVFDDDTKAESMRADWARWDPGARLDIIDSPQHALVHPVIDYVEQMPRDDRPVTVLIPQVEPKHSRYRVLENHRGFLMAGLLSAHTDAIVCLLKLEVDL
ncbi:APC family permease [Streptomyces sp. NPDC098781]|uniref:APC family permease n=1 Tax=Streptomyces sp. NPDC098781 TaxID=3366097 RepID=UPI0037F6D37D